MRIDPATNVVVATEEPFVEETWAGRVVQVGEESLDLGEDVHSLVPALVLAHAGLEVGAEGHGEVVLHRDPHPEPLGLVEQRRQELRHEHRVVRLAVEHHGVDLQVVRQP